MSDRPFEDIVNELYPPPRRAPVLGLEERMKAQLVLIRVTLGLNPIHDPVECVRVLYEEGREAFEKLRGPACPWAADWSPS